MARALVDIRWPVVQAAAKVKALMRSAFEARPRAHHAELAAVVVLTGLSVALRIEMLTARTVWHDEAFSLAVARKPAAYILQHLPASDPHPPGYYLLLRAALLLFGDSLEVARGLSAALGVVAVWLTWWVGRRVLEPAAAVAGATLVALNPFQVFASNEIRMYPLATCLGLMSTLAAWRATRLQRLRDWLLYGVTLAGMAYTSYYTVLVAVGQWAWLVIRRHNFGLAVGLATAGILYAPWVLRVPRGVPDIVFVREPFRTSHVFETWATHAYGGYLFKTTTYLATGGFDPAQHILLVLPFGLLAVAGCIALWGKARGGALLVASVWLVGVSVWASASAILGHLVAYPRHLVFLQPFFAMLVGAGVVHLGYSATRVPGPLVASGAALLVLAFLWPALGNLQGNPEYQSFRYDQAARLVRALYRPGDALVFYQGGAQRAFREYFDPGGLQIAIEPEFGRWTRPGMRPILEKAAEPLRTVRGRIWLVLVWPYPPDSPLDLIEALERFGYRRAARRNFNGVEVVVLARPDRP